MNLTKEHFDKAIKKLATQNDLTKQTDLLITHTSVQMESLARIIQVGFEGVQARLDVADKVLKLENEIKEIRAALQM